MPSDTARSGFVRGACLSKDLGGLRVSGQECCRQRAQTVQRPGGRRVLWGANSWAARKSKLVNMCVVASSTEETLETRLLGTARREHLFPRSCKYQGLLVQGHALRGARSLGPGDHHLAHLAQCGPSSMGRAVPAHTLQMVFPQDHQAWPHSLGPALCQGRWRRPCTEPASELGSRTRAPHTHVPAVHTHAHTRRCERAPRTLAVLHTHTGARAHMGEACVNTHAHSYPWTHGAHTSTYDAAHGPYTLARGGVNTSASTHAFPSSSEHHFRTCPPPPPPPSPSPLPPAQQWTRALAFHYYRGVRLESPPAGLRSSRNPGKTISALSILKTSGPRGQPSFWDWPRTPSECGSGRPGPVLLPQIPECPAQGTVPPGGGGGNPTMESHSDLWIFLPAVPLPSAFPAPG